MPSEHGYVRFSDDVLLAALSGAGAVFAVFTPVPERSDADD